MIHTAKRLTFLFVFVTAFTAAGYGQSAGAPPIYELRFIKNIASNTGTVQVPGPCPANGPAECGSGGTTTFSMKGTKGNYIRIRLKSDTGRAVFTIISPSREALKNGSGVKSWTGTLPANGDFQIHVYSTKGYTPFIINIHKR